MLPSVGDKAIEAWYDFIIEYPILLHCTEGTDRTGSGVRKSRKLYVRSDVDLI